MRCGSSGTSAVSGCTPAALWAVRVDGPASAPAGCGAHDSSGRRWLPKTPAPAIWVVLVMTDADADPLRPAGVGVQPPHSCGCHRCRGGSGQRASRTPEQHGSDVNIRPGETDLSNGAARLDDSVHRAITTVCRTSPSPGPLEG